MTQTPDPALVDLFLQLVRVDALSGAERPVASFVRGFLEPLGVEVGEDDAGDEGEDPSGNLICRLRGGCARALVAHMDTARPTRDVAPRVLTDRITSDGTTILGADNRAGMALALHTLRRLAEETDRPGTAIFTVREETDFGGSRALEPPGEVQSAYILDSSHPPGDYIARGYGAVEFKARLHGRAAHAGVAPERGINAIEAASRAIASISWGRLDETSTSNVGRIHGGSATNVVAEEATVEGEARALDPERLESVGHQIESAFRDAANAAGAELEFRLMRAFDAYELSSASPAVRFLERAMRSANLEPSACETAGGSDAHVLNARGLQAVNLGIGARNPHGNDEYILLSDLASAAELAWQLMTLDELSEP